MRGIRKTTIDKSFVVRYRKDHPFLSHLRTDANTCGVAYFDQTNLIGIVNVGEKRDGKKWIQALEVTKPYQGQGYGKRLLQDAIRLGGEYISVNRTNKIALNLYQSEGFFQIGGTRDMIFMCCKNEVFGESSNNNGDKITYSNNPNGVKEIIETLPYKEKSYIGSNIDKNFAQEFIQHTKYLRYREVLHVNSVPVSFLDIVINGWNSENPNEEEGFIVLATRSESKYCRCGYGGMLVERMLKKIRAEKKFKKLYWEFDNDNGKSCAMGEKYGFYGKGNTKEYIVESSSDEMLEEMMKYKKERKKLLEKTLDVLKEMGIKPKIEKKEQENWIETGWYNGKGKEDSFGDSLCLAALGTMDTDKVCKKVNPEIMALNGKLSPDNYGTSFLSYNYEMNEFQESTIKDRILRTIVKSEALHNGVLVNGDSCIIYHGSDQRLDELIPQSPNFGNFLEKPKMAIFTWMKKESAINWGIFRALHRTNRQRLFKEKLRINYNPIESRIMLDDVGYEIISQYLKSHKLYGYVYSIEVPVTHVGLGNDSTHHEYTLYERVKPFQMDTIELNSKNLDDFVVKYNPEDYDKILNNFYYLMLNNRGILSALMIYEFGWQRIEQKELIDVMFPKDGPLDEFTDVEEVLKTHGLRFKKLFPLKRLYHYLIGKCVK